MVQRNHRYYNANLEDIGNRQGKLLIRYGKNFHQDGNMVSLVHGLSSLESVFSGEFQFKKGNVNTPTEKIRGKYQCCVGQNKIPQNLAYLLLMGHPAYHFRRVFNFGKFKPISKEELSLKVSEACCVVPEDDGIDKSLLGKKTKGFSREDEFRIFMSSDFHRTRLHSAGKAILESNSSRRGYCQEVRELVDAYEHVSFFVNGIVEANMGLLPKMSYEIFGAYDKNDLIEESLGAANNAAEKFNCCEINPKTGNKIKFSTYLGTSALRKMKGFVKKKDRADDIKKSASKTEKVFRKPNNELGVRGELICDILASNLAGLDERELKIICNRYGFWGDALTLGELSKLIGVTKERVRQIEVRAMKKVAKRFRREYHERYGERLNLKILEE